MLSEDTQNLLGRILLALAEGERNVEEARKEISDEDSYDIQAIFKVLDENGDNFITAKDIQKYLIAHGLEVNFIEIKLLILFYDQDHDFALTYGEIFKIIHPGREYPRIPRYKQDEELNVKVDRKLYNLLEKEIIMARNVLALLDDIKHKRDFDIHNAFHLLKYYACITGDSINVFLNNIGMKPTAGDVRAIVKRLDINKDDIIDFCEFHAFLGYPDCSFCCPCFPCPNCGTKYCINCLQDIPCYLLGCDHKGMDSKMRCTSLEHNPGMDGASTVYGSVRTNLSPSSRQKNKFSSKMEEDEKNDDNYSNIKGIGKSSNSNLYGNNNQFYPPGFNNYQNGQYYSPLRNGYNRNNISPEQFKLLQGLTNPEQLNKFMTISGILDRQNTEAINLTDNLSLRLSPIRDFNPKEWGCRNCPCNIHSNPNVPCDCCTCNICPFKTNTNQEKQKPIKFPKNSFYSYSYSYDPDSNMSNASFLSTTYGPNSSTYMNSPKRRNVIFDKEINKYKKTMPNSSDDEKEYEDYMRKVNNIKDTFRRENQPYDNSINPGNIPNRMINNNRMNNNIHNMNNNINDNEEESYYDNRSNNVEVNENEEEENIRKNKIFLQRTYKNEKNINENITRKKIGKKGKRKINEEEEDYEDEDNDEDNFHSRQNQNQERGQDPNQQQINNNNLNNNPNFYGQNNRIPNQNMNNSISKRGTSKSFPTINNTGNPIITDNQNNFSISGNNNNNDNNYNNNNDNNYNNNNDNNSNYNNNYNNSQKFDNNQRSDNNQKLDPFDETTTTIYNINGKNNNKKKKNLISSKVAEESEEEITNNNPNFLHMSHVEIINEQEKIFLQYLKALIKSEREIEFAKRDLMRQKDFNAEDAFRLFEVEGTGVVTKKDLIYGLKLLGIKPTNNQITIIFNRYDLDGNNFMEYHDFFDMVISFKDEDRKEETNRKPNRRIGNRNIKIFSQRTRDLFKKLFLVIIEEEERLEELKQRLNIDENVMREIFNKINVDKDGLCNKNEFANYCLKNKICKERKDAHLIFIRLNRNRDGGLESKEFDMELKSSILGQ